MSEWILPFQGRHSSAQYNVNFLWRSDRLYVMDNHRMALWCWWRHLPEATDWQLLHIDRHYDTMSSQLETWLQSLPQDSASLEDYLAQDYVLPFAGSMRAPVIRWDNYLSIFLARYGNRLSRVVFVTACEGDEPRHPLLEKADPWRGLEVIEEIGHGGGYVSCTPWLVNVDLDYFTAQDSQDDSHFRVYDNAYIERVGRGVALGLQRGRIRCATVALSPETTGTWATAEELMRVFLGPWGEYPRLE